MRFREIKSHLQPYRMLARRRTTINHMFAAAVAPHDVFEESRVRHGVAMLGNDPEENLSCAYCGIEAESWDHVFATVKNSRFSGHGHRLGNLLPCCKPCNSRKGNKHWQEHLGSLQMNETERARRALAIQQYLQEFSVIDHLHEDTPDHRRLEELRSQILSLIEEADAVAARVRVQAGTMTKGYIHQVRGG